MEHVNFPLAVYRNDKLKKHIAKRHWKMEHFFMRQDYYTLIFDNRKQMNLMKDTTIDHVVIEKVFYSRKVVQQFLFNRINGQWMMTSINYKPMYQEYEFQLPEVLWILCHGYGFPVSPSA